MNTLLNANHVIRLLNKWQDRYTGAKGKDFWWPLALKTVAIFLPLPERWTDPIFPTDERVTFVFKPASGEGGYLAGRRPLDSWKAMVSDIKKYLKSYDGSSLGEDALQEMMNQLNVICPEFDPQRIRDPNGIFAEAALDLFSFQTGPVRASASSTEIRPGREHPFGNFRPYSASAEQLVFIDPAPSSRALQDGGKSERPLDEYAKSMAHDRRADGIHALAGGRGSGKSTILNRIEWFCNNWEKPRDGIGWRPVLVRFDLAGGLNRRQFTIDLFAHLCRSIHEHVKSGPITHHSRFRFLRDFAGNVGRFARTNFIWMVVVTLLLGAGYFAQKFYAASFKIDFAVFFAALLVCIIMAGCAAGYTLARRWKEIYPDHAPLWIAATGIVPILAWNCLLSLPYVPNVGASSSLLWEQPELPSDPVLSTSPGKPFSWNSTPKPVSLSNGWMRPTIGGLALTAGLTALFWGISMLLLPRWWWTYLDSQNQLRALRYAKDSKGGFDLTFLTPLYGVLQAVLPQFPGTAEDVKDQELTFQQDSLKQFLGNCVDAFGRVVFLIDDMDTIRQRHFPKLLQLLRPLGKVDGVCCVIAVPKYFYYGLKIRCKTDLHSTLQQCRLVGNPVLDAEQWSDLSALETIMKPLLVSRLDFRVYEGDKSEPLQVLAKHVSDFWLQDLGPFHKKRAVRNLKEKPSRRELLRETQRMLRAWMLDEGAVNEVAVQGEDPADKGKKFPFGDRAVKDDKKDNADFHDERDDYKKCEELLINEGARCPTSDA